MATRIEGREPDQLREVAFALGWQSHPAGSVLVSFGGTRVNCSVSVTDGVPRWMRQQNVGGGWLTAEYRMLPGATGRRTERDCTRGTPSGRNLEIQRLIGRSLRAVVDLSKIPRKTLYVDCDVVDADGGTRCAAITGSAVAAELAFRNLFAAGELKGWPVMTGSVAAVSVGILNGEPVLDLCYAEDATASVDMNVVMTGQGRFVEIQGCAEEEAFSEDELAAMLRLARKGLSEIFELQTQALSRQPA